MPMSMRVLPGFPWMFVLGIDGWFPLTGRLGSSN